jgi:hypothetical protein
LTPALSRKQLSLLNFETTEKIQVGNQKAVNSKHILAVLAIATIP